MRFPRVKAEGQSFYHCVSRVVDRQFIFQTAGHGSPEAERSVPGALPKGTTAVMVVMGCSGPNALRCRIRYFTDGLILRGQSLVESHFYNLKHKLGYQRRRPATRLTPPVCADKRIKANTESTSKKPPRSGAIHARCGSSSNTKRKNDLV